MATEALVCLSLNAHGAPLKVREQLAILPEQLPALVAALHPLASEVLVLSTCNRFEVYLIPRSPRATPEELARAVIELRGADPEQLLPFVWLGRDGEAAEHLFRVASGLESLVIGETQILGQVRRALDDARALKAIGHRLGSLVQRALATGKRVHDETALGRGALSVSRMAVDRARHTLGDLSQRTVLLVGAGETAQLAAKALQGVGQLLVVNRTFARAKALAHQAHGEALPWSALSDALAVADLAISCVGAPEPTITRPMVESIRERRGGQPLLLVDLSVPRGVEASVDRVPDTRLVSLDDLEERRTANQDERLLEVPHAEAILAEQLRTAWTSWKEADAHDSIAALRLRAEEVRQAELERAQRSLGDLSPEHGEAVQVVTRAIVNKLLHQPTAWLKSNPATADAALRDIFGIRSAA